MLRFLFPISLFLSAVLLFSIQPMVAKALLPVYGGTPAVWTVCMLFFQLILLVSYGYVWLLSFFNKPTNWRLVHSLLVILSLSALPLLFHPFATDGHPEWNIILNLLTQLGLPLFIVGASAPLLQFAYSQTKGKGASDPYFLYAASNLGSLLSLLLYPWVIEHFIGLTHQFNLWSIGYVVYLVILFLVLYVARYQPLERNIKEVAVWPWRQMMFWVFLSFVPCSLMLGVTLYITTDVAATPLFWVLPLALYLLTFVITFTSRPLISHAWVVRNSLFFLIFTVVGFIIGINQIRAWVLILCNLLSFFVLALLCHGELFQRRPKPQLLTLFYFCLSLGGVLAGIFNGIVAPHWFNRVYEYPIAIVLSLLALPLSKGTRVGWGPLLILVLLLTQSYLPEIHWPKGFTSLQVAALIAMVILVLQQSKASMFLSMSILFVFIFSPYFQVDTILAQERSFYGVKRIIEKNGAHLLLSQSTLHGFQLVGEKKSSSGLGSYYGATKSVVETVQQEYNPVLATIIGLGTGTMICQFRKSDQVKIIEIDQQMIDIAKNPKLFTYLRDCPPSVTIIKNDGRLALANLPDGMDQLLVLDAFNSDAIPVHLMTLEAFTLYKNKISKDGVILVHLSNRHLQLLPVINAVGRSLEMMVFYLDHKGDRKKGQFSSQWALLTSNQSLAFKIMKGSGWRFMTDGKQLLWTDDYSNIIPLLRG